MSQASPHHVFDADHTLINTFFDAEEAHRFAHDASREPGVRLPLEIEDLADRTTRLVWPNRCRSIRWMALDRSDPCALQPAMFALAGSDLYSRHAVGR
jgi:hypothetical protein